MLIAKKLTALAKGVKIRAMRAGALTTADQPTGTRTWQDYLDERYGAVADSQA